VIDFIESTDPFTSLSLISVTGNKVNLPKISDAVWDARSVAPGFYVGVGERNGSVARFKIIKR
jgi:hypothetical protein